MGTATSVRVRLRPATLADLDVLLALEHEIFPEYEFSRNEMRYLLRHLRAETTLAVAAGGDTAGFIIVWWRKGASTCRIIDLAVRRRFQRSGIGRRLVRHAVAFAQARKFAGITLEVAESNRSARALYAGLGFVVDRRLPNYYDPGEHALRLLRPAGRRSGTNP